MRCRASFAALPLRPGSLPKAAENWRGELGIRLRRGSDHKILHGSLRIGAQIVVLFPVEIPILRILHAVEMPCLICLAAGRASDEVFAERQSADRSRHAIYR